MNIIYGVNCRDVTEYATKHNQNNNAQQIYEYGLFDALYITSKWNFGSVFDNNTQSVGKKPSLIKIQLNSCF